MNPWEIYKVLLVLVVAVIGPRSNVTAIDCTFSWCCLLTCGLYNCYKSKSDDNYDEAISAQEKDPDPLDPSQHPTELKISTEGSTSENDTDKYKVYKREGTGDTYVYKFNQNVKCTLIKCNDKEVWKHDDKVDSTVVSSNPLSFIYHEKEKVFILWDGSYSTFAIDNGRKWEESSAPQEVKVTTEKSGGNSKEIDPSKHKVHHPSGNDDFIVYVFSEDFKCTKIAHGDNEVWKYNPGDPSVFGFTYKKDNSFTIYHEGDYTTFTLINGKWQNGSATTTTNNTSGSTINSTDPNGTTN